MTTHDMQPETVDPTVRTDRPVEAETPLETGDASGSFQPPMETADRSMETADRPMETADRPMETADRPMETADLHTETAAPPVADPTPIADAPPVADPTPIADSTPAATDSADRMLFAESELSDLRSRWTEVQSAFVDDPRDCVQKADGLVADVVDKLTAGFSGARSQLEEQWARGEQASTEDLRVALKRYREFFERLLAV